MAQTLEELARESRQFVELNKSAKKINFEVFERLYPDKTHFIYELLQNAEDAEAKTVSFRLSAQKLIFEHDGDLLFTFANVESITNIGFSSKVIENNDDKPKYNPIGKFGVGFKAVYAYTKNPEIHSGEFHFRIEDLLVPVTDGVDQKPLGPRVTRFLFPFDHPEKTPEKAAAEIEERLRLLKDNTLLFLRHIHRIKYTLPSGESGSLERIEDDNDHVEIRFKFSDEEIHSTHWLRFQKDLPLKDEKGQTKDHSIAVAYQPVEKHSVSG